MTRFRNLTIVVVCIFCILLLSGEALACGAPAPIFGRAAFSLSALPDLKFSVHNAVLELSENEGGNVIALTRTSMFGYYRFPVVLPCSSYRVKIIHKWYDFQPDIRIVTVEDFPKDGSGFEVNFTAVR